MDGSGISVEVEGGRRNTNVIAAVDSFAGLQRRLEQTMEEGTQADQSDERVPKVVHCCFRWLSLDANFPRAPEFILFQPIKRFPSKGDLEKSSQPSMSSPVP